MKKFLTAFCLLASCAVFSQAPSIPNLRQGTKLHYLISTQEGSNTLVVSLDSVSSQYMKWGWMMEDHTQGSWIIKKKSLETASQGWWGQLEGNTQTEVADDQVVGMFSKAQWDAVQKEKKVVYDMVTYVVKSGSGQQRFKIGEKEVNAIFLESSNGTSKITILNNPALPLILRLDGNTVGPDILLKSVE